MSWDLVLGFFPEEMQRLILDNTISDLMINGTMGVFADRNGIVEHIPLASALTTDTLLAATQQIARKLGQNLSDQNPILNTRLPDGSRVAVVGPPASINGITMTIRKFNRWYTSDELIASGSLPERVRDTVVRLVGERKNGIISGGTGSGKTTLMKALLDHVPLHERLIVIEQPAELKVEHPNAIRWEAVEAIPGQVAITPSQLVAAALRHRPDRIIMGEIRDQCGYDLLQAMNTGHGGTLSTIHAKSAWDALNRLSDLALSARPNLNHAFVRSETAEAIDFVLYCERDHTGNRRVRELIHCYWLQPRGSVLPDGGDLPCFGWCRFERGSNDDNRPKSSSKRLIAIAQSNTGTPKSSRLSAGVVERGRVRRIRPYEPVGRRCFDCRRHGVSSATLLGKRLSRRSRLQRQFQSIVRTWRPIPN